MGLRDMLARWTGRAPTATMPPMDDDSPTELWTVTELADWLGVSRQNVHDRVQRGTLRPHYFARYGARTFYLFDPARVKRWRQTLT